MQLVNIWENYSICLPAPFRAPTVFNEYLLGTEFTLLSLGTFRISVSGENGHQLCQCQLLCCAPCCSKGIFTSSVHESILMRENQIESEPGDWKMPQDLISTKRLTSSFPISFKYIICAASNLYETISKERINMLFKFIKFKWNHLNTFSYYPLMSVKWRHWGCCSQQENLPFLCFWGIQLCLSQMKILYSYFTLRICWFMDPLYSQECEKPLWPPWESGCQLGEK